MCDIASLLLLCVPARAHARTCVLVCQCAWRVCVRACECAHVQLLYEPGVSTRWQRHVERGDVGYFCAPIRAFEDLEPGG